MNFKTTLIVTAFMTVGLTACGGSNNSAPTPVAPTPPVNRAPTDISLSNSNVDENAAGAEIGALTATDPDSGDTFTFSVDNTLFAISGSTLSLATSSSLDYEDATSHTVNVTVTDNNGNSFTKQFTINVNDIQENSAPTDIALSNASVAENAMGATIGTLTATDADSGDTFTFAVDNALFTVNGNTLSLASNSSLDYETATSHEVNITVTDAAGETFTKTLTISVEDVNEAVSGNAKTYAFTSRFADGAPSVDYRDQTIRQVQMAEFIDYLKNEFAGELDADNGPIKGKRHAVDKMYSFYHLADEAAETKDPFGREYTVLSFDDNTKGAGTHLPIDFIDNSRHAVVGDISSNNIILRSAMVGNRGDSQEQAQNHKNWNDGASFVGWSADINDPDQYFDGPNELITVIFDVFGNHVTQELFGKPRKNQYNNQPIPLNISLDGIDMTELLQALFMTGISYAQVTDNLLDEGIGSDIDNNKRFNGTSHYTQLEHNFDQAFGYFGAARDYLDYTNEEIASQGGRSDYQGNHDTNGDNLLDVMSEVNFGMAIEAAKRSLTTAENGSGPDFSKEIMEAFIAGRELIHSAEGNLTAAQQLELENHRDTIVNTWEKALVATVIHYINKTTDALAKLNTEAFSYNEVVYYHSRMKGLALGIQFNPNAVLSETQFAELHGYLKLAPVLASKPASTTSEGGNVKAPTTEEYIKDLETASKLLQDTYALDGNF